MKVNEKKLLSFRVAKRREPNARYDGLSTGISSWSISRGGAATWIGEMRDGDKQNCQLQHMLGAGRSDVICRE
jgi:hypothetical protein